MNASVTPGRRAAAILVEGATLVLALAAVRGPGLASPRAPIADAPVERFLAERFRMTPSQIAAVGRGEAVAVDLPSGVGREIAIGGAIRVGAPPERLAALVRDIERLESGEGFQRTKKVSDPPRLEDFDDLELPAEDVAALRTCRPGKCDVKLGQGAFDLLRQIDWSAADATTRVNALARRTALEYLQAYRAGGNGELAIYRDSDRPQFIAREFADMVRRTGGLPDALPELADYLLNYPKASRPAGLDEFFYWSIADFGLKPVIRINHVVICPMAGPAGTRFAIATKQLYASHYFHTALEVRVAVDDPAQPGAAHYLVVLNMARSDGLTGLFGGIVKSKARSGSRDGLVKALAATKRRCEAIWLPLWPAGALDRELTRVRWRPHDGVACWPQPVPEPDARHDGVEGSVR